MTIQKRQERGIIIDLTGPDGNVFVLMGYAKKFAEQLKEDLFLIHGITSDEVIKEMMSSDYENAVQTFDKYFGEFVILER